MLTLILICLENRVFLDDLKLTDISPIFKKEDSLNKENYRPVSILPCQKYLKRFFTTKLIVL